MSIGEILQTIESYRVQHVLITGGEPLLQRNTPQLVLELGRAGYQVSIETHGEVSIASVSEQARIIMDIKTPGSKMCRMGFEKNFAHLKPQDEIKFVITSEEDYTFARDWVQSGRLPTREILFSPALPALHSPAPSSGVDPRWLAEKILEDRLPVRFQLQLHKQIWGLNTPGV